MSIAPKSFCVAPWLESVLYNDGSFRICSRNHRVFGQWKDIPLSTLWNSAELQNFRKDIAAGKFPDQDCKACYEAGSYQTFRRILNAPATNAIRVIWESKVVDDAKVGELEKIPLLFDEWNEQISNSSLEILKTIDLPDARKLEKLISVVKSFHEANLQPEVVGPFRQVQLIAKCNARCVMCPGNFTGELENGDAIAETSIDRALDKNEDILDFFCNGSEFLLFKGWRQIAAKLAEGGCQALRISTNGMLLTEENAKYLVDHKVISHFNVSLNAASHENLEKIQRNVRYLRMIKNVEFFLSYAREKKVYFPMSFSFILLRSNFHELPAYIEMIHKFSQFCDQIKPHALVMSLENAGLSGYRTFLFEEHPDFLPLEERQEYLRKAKETASRLGVEVELYNFGSAKSWDDLIRDGIPGFVPLEVDQESIEAIAREVLDPHWEEAFASAKKTVENWFARDRFPLGNTRKFARELSDRLSAALSETLMSVSAKIPSKLRFVCDEYPQHLILYKNYCSHYTRALLVRLQQQIEIYEQKIFKETVGAHVEDLRDHHGDTVLPVAAHRIEPGSRVLGKDQKQYIFWEDGAMITLEDPKVHAALLYPKDFLEGVFLFDDPPAPKLTANVDKSDHTKISETPHRSDFLRPGSEITCWQDDPWIFLHQSQNVFYLSPKNSDTLHILPKKTIEEAYYWKAGTLPSSKIPLLRMAIRHARWNLWKSRIIGNKKSKVLWSLSRIYRGALAKKGVQMPDDLVIGESNPSS